MIVVLMPDFEGAEQVVPDIGRLGVERQEIYAASHDSRALAAFTGRLGVSEVRLNDTSNPISALLFERLAPSRVSYFTSKLQDKRVLLVLPHVGNAPQTVGILQRAGADFGPDATDGELREVRVPLRAERLDVKKFLVQSGTVRVYKEIVTEVERIEVALVREEFVVERTPADGSDDVAIVRIPLSHEELSIAKRTVVTNEVSIRREQHSEIRRVEEPLRYEQMHVTKAGSVALHESPL